MNDQGDDEAVGADPDWSEEAFVPAGDAEPAQRKPLRDLTAGEFARHLRWLRRPAQTAADAPSREAF